MEFCNFIILHFSLKVSFIELRKQKILVCFYFEEYYFFSFFDKNGLNLDEDTFKLFRIKYVMVKMFSVRIMQDVYEVIIGTLLSQRTIGIALPGTFATI